MPQDIFKSFKAAGEDLIGLGLISTHGGNISIRQDKSMLITVHFAMLGRLGPGDLTEVPLSAAAGEIGAEASNDASLHLNIYRSAQAGAIVHAHPPHAVALSLKGKTIVPRDLEGAFLLKEVLVVDPAEAPGRLSQLLNDHVAVMVKGHGSYVAGPTLNEALAYTSALELSCRITCLSMMINRDN